MEPYGSQYLEGAVDGHVHACPHLNGRSGTVFDAVRAAAAAGMRGLGLMDNFQNSAGYAALAMRELGHLGVDVFGGLIMQPAAGGVSLEAARTAIGYGYAPGDGARFISLPTHHTRFIARQEGRAGLYLESAFAVPEAGPLPDPVPAILALCAEHDVVFDCGHVSGPEAVRLAEEAQARGVRRLRAHGNGYDEGSVRAIAALGGHIEFSLFELTQAAQVGLTHVDREKHRAAARTIDDVLPRIRAAGERAVASSDSGIYLLAPPTEAFRQFLVLLEAAGCTPDEIRRMASRNPAQLFRVGERPREA
ncbi:MAG: amidohydrolase family protein [Methylobacteriaceae bacterium]|nr:amidohydrolase family protein [Methylobacteriaceae bacterium]